jgi:hypothetical protein
MRVRGLATVLGVMAGLSISGVSHASYPAGVWVKVQSVVLVPNAAAPEKILIQGAAMVYDGSQDTSYYGYAEPALGSLYYACPKGQETTCLDEWKDVEKNIADPSNVCVGLGDQKIATGTLHPPGAHPTTADPYPIAMGVLPGFVPCEILGAYLTSGTGGAGGVAGGAGTTSNGGAGGASGSAGASATGGVSQGSGGSAGSAAGGSGEDPAAADDAGASRGCAVVAPTRGSLMGFMALLALAALGVVRRVRN